MTIEAAIRDELNRRVAASVKRIGRRVVVNRPVFEDALLGRDADPDTRPQFVTIPQLVADQPAFSEQALRQLIARAEKAVAEATRAAA